MRLLLFITLLFFVNVAIGCDRKIPVLAQVQRILDSEVFEISIEVPTRHENFRLSGSHFNRAENYIPMYKGYEIEGKAVYKLRGTKGFFGEANVSISFTAIDALCAHSEKVDLMKAIQNCSDCAKDA